MNISLGIPQIIIIVIYMLSLGIDLANHGKERKGKYNVGTSIVAVVITFGILYWGGFFS